MRRVDARLWAIVALVVLAAGLGYYRMQHRPPLDARADAPLPAVPADPTPERIRSMSESAAQLFGAPKKYIAHRSSVDSGRVMLESSLGVPAAFDELRLILALTDSVRSWGYTVAATKNLKEKTTTIRCRDLDHQSIYRCILYRKELPH